MALLEWEGPCPLSPTGPLFPKPCSSPAPTYLSTCIKPPGLGMGVKGKRTDTRRSLTHNHPDQPSQGKRVELSGHGNRSSDFRAGGWGDLNIQDLGELLNYPSGLPYPWHYLARGYSLLIPKFPSAKRPKSLWNAPALSLYLQVNKN